MKEGICKCGKKYYYIGLDLGYCTKCLDSFEMSEQEIQYEKTLEKGIRILKENPNQTTEILKVATRLSYLRGRLFEQKDKNELQKTYDIAMQEINRLRKLLGYDSQKTKETKNG